MYPYNLGETGTETIEKNSVDEAIKDLFMKKIVLFNDNHNSFDHVILSLIEICGHQMTQAEQCAIIVHNNGKCEVKRGSIEELVPLAEALSDRDLTVEIQ
jgi:ATP-dependent Clp protease adaptor protein ClpS